MKKEIWRLKPNGDEVDEILLRFPHLGQQIFEQLDSNMLARCVEVKRPWQKFIEDEKLQILSNTMLKQFLGKKDLKKLEREVQTVYDKYPQEWNEEALLHPEYQTPILNGAARTHFSPRPNLAPGSL